MKDEENVMKKAIEKTHLGPEESPERVENERNKIKQAKEQMKRDMIEQMNKKQREKNEEKMKNMKIDEELALFHQKDWENDAVKADFKDKAQK
jgi:hypothetical protein